MPDLSKLEIEEISLVDEACVPKARKFLIVKRKGGNGMSDEKTQTEEVKTQKNEEDPIVIRLDKIIDLLKPAEPKVQEDEMQKQLDTLKKENAEYKELMDKLPELFEAYKEGFLTKEQLFGEQEKEEDGE